MVIAIVVERVYVLSLDRLLIGTDDVPPAALVVREGRVIGLAQIRTLANRRKSLGLDGNDLSPQSQSQCAAAQRFGESDEGLLNIESVPVDRCEPRDARGDGNGALAVSMPILPRQAPEVRAHGDCQCHGIRSRCDRGAWSPWLRWRPGGANPFQTDLHRGRCGANERRQAQGPRRPLPSQTSAIMETAKPKVHNRGLSYDRALPPCEFEHYQHYPRG